MTVNSHILRLDGSITDCIMNSDNFNFDYTKYLDENGELYFYEHQGIDKVQTIITTKGYYLQLKNGIALNNIQQPTKTKKLGIGHVIITYVWLPLCILGCIINIIKGIATININIILTNILLVSCELFVLISSIYAFICLVRRNREAYPLIQLACISMIFSGLVYDIVGLMLALGSYYLPIATALYTIIYFLIRIYYSKRKEHFNNPQIGSLLRDSEEFVAVLPSIYVYILPFVIYGYSVFYMFQSAIWYGMFGVFVPVIAQLVYLVSTGFNTEYAFLCYFTAIAFGCTLVMAKTIERD